MRSALFLMILFFTSFHSEDQSAGKKVMIVERQKIQESHPATCPPLDSSVYLTYRIVRYDNLPQPVKALMQKSHCAALGKQPSAGNNYRTNIDYGYSIQLGNGKHPEYIFCCEQPAHGPCNAMIFSEINGSWKIVRSGFVGFSNEDPTVNIKVLKTRHEGYADLFEDNHLLIFRDGSYR